MAILIVLVFGFIIGVVFSQRTKTDSVRPIIITTVIGLAVGIFFSMVRVVPAGYAGIVDLFGRVSAQPLRSGLNIVNPLSRVVMMSVRTQEMTEMMSIPSKEGLNVTLDISILYRLEADRAVEVYRNIGPYYRDIIVTPQFRSVARGVTVNYEAKALYTSEREVLAQAIYDTLEKMTKERGVVIERVLLRSINLPITVSAAIEQKLKAEQEAERMKFILQKETQEAERKRIEAAGIRDAQAIIDQSLTQQYLHYLWINTLNENPNVIYVATEANMPIFRAINPDEENAHKKPIITKDQREQQKIVK